MDKKVTHQIVKPKTLAGFQDLLPADAMAQNHLIDQIKTIFHSFGFSPIQTPHLEYSEMLLSESDGEIGKQLFRFQDNGDRDVCLRYDLTVPLARFVVEHLREIGLPFKRYAIGSCFRGERPQQGRYREFTQCDFDILGVDSVFADLEILQVIAAGFQKLGLRIILKLNSRELLNSFIAMIGLADHSIDFIRHLDKKNKIDAETFEAGLRELGCNDDQLEQVLLYLNYATSASSNLVLIENLKTIPGASADFLFAVEKTEILCTLANQTNAKDSLSLDLSLARGFGYYTGHVFETVLVDVPEVGSVAGGGRYNNLTQNFSKELIPGVGASFGVSRILYALSKLNTNQQLTSADILVANLDIEVAPNIIELASKLREQGLRVELYPEVAKLKKQLQFADRKKIPYILIFGATEAEKKILILKNLLTGEQLEIKDISEVTSKISV